MSGKNPLGSGKEPQSYEGLNIIVPVGGFTVVKATRDPTTNDKKYPTPSLWLNKSTGALWYLAKAAGTWIEISVGAGVVDTLTGDTGGALNPTAGNINILGTANQITSAGSGSTITLSLIGPYAPATYTPHGVLIGEGTGPIVATTAGTDGQVLTGNTGIDPSFQAIGTKSGLTQFGVLLAEGTGAFQATAVGATGTVLAGVTGANPTYQAIPALNVFDSTSTPVTVVVNATYIADNASALTVFNLPATAAVGTEVSIVGNGPGGWQIVANGGQTIKMNANTTTSGGSMSSTNRYNGVTIVCTVANTTWVVNDFSGAFTFA